MLYNVYSPAVDDQSALSVVQGDGEEGGEDEGGLQGPGHQHQESKEGFQVQQVWRI